MGQNDGFGLQARPHAGQRRILTQPRGKWLSLVLNGFLEVGNQIFKVMDSLIEQIATQHRQEYATEPTVICSAPGNIELLGEHGESCLGYVLSLAIDRRCYVSMSQRQDNLLCFYSVNLKEKKRFSINSLRDRKEDRWASCIKRVFKEFVYRGHKLSGVSVTISSEIPMDIGLDSLTALTIATTYALKELFKLDMTHEQIIEVAMLIASPSMKMPEAISSLMVTCHAKEGHLCLIDVFSREIEYLPFPFSSVSIVVTDSQVPETIKDEEKTRIDVACSECMEAVGVSQTKGLFRNLTRDDLVGSVKGLSERSRRICIHLIAENERIQEFRTALGDGMYDIAGRVLSSSHRSLRDNLEVSSPELDWLAKRGSETEGVYGSRMIGFGYGGSMITLLSNGKQYHYEKCLEEYDRIFGFKASVFPMTTGNGAIVHRNRVN